MCSLPSIPLLEFSNGERRLAYFGMHQDTALTPPIKERIALQVLGKETDANAEIW